MTKYIDKDALVAEIEKKINRCKKILFDLRTRQNKDYYQGKREAYIDILSFLDTIEVKDVKEEHESIWHYAYKQPTMYRKYLVRYSDGRVSGSWERHDNGFVPWKDVIKEHGFTHWCYVEDLIKL